LPGFAFRYRLHGGVPTIESFIFKNTRTLTGGDLVNYEDGRVDLGVAGDSSLVGVAIETLDGEGRTTSIRVIVDADAVYGVHDPYQRRRGDRLDLCGATGAQGVVASASQLVVVVDSSQEEETLVSIRGDRHHAARAAGEARAEGGALNAAITRAVVGQQRAMTGRGPNRAHAFYRGDVIVVILEETMTRSERSLVAAGQHETVRQFRVAVQDAMRAPLIETVERLTGAKVRAFMSTHHVDPDLAVSVFLLDRPVPVGAETGAQKRDADA
jgi:uncharacterized protein YbcI